jgi:co-chaperonin GroES (HSP10)
MRFKPLKGNLLVKPSKSPEKSGNIILVSFNPNQVVDGVVLAVGETDLKINEHDSVLYQFAAGQEVKIDDETYHLLADDRVLGVRPENSSSFFEVPDSDIYVIGFEKGEHTTKAGIIITDDQMTERGIRPRWAQVWQVGKKWKDDISPGQWILLEHGNWSHIITLTDNAGNKVDMQIIEEKSIRRGLLGVQDEMPEHLQNYK